MEPPARLKTLLEAIGHVYVEWMVVEMGRVGLKDSELVKHVTFAVDYANLTVNLTLPYYAQYVESGRRAGARMPPFDVILKWVTKKFGVAGANDLAWKIRSSIAKKGIRARPFSDKAADDTLNQISHVDAPITLQLYVDEELENIFFHKP